VCTVDGDQRRSAASRPAGASSFVSLIIAERGRGRRAK
jgi:hypothetical protein